ncbi:acylneuraminate cytidylyltransferase family protein [bacterium]|nr:acylneuraminate cytidylyltransferase family protein [bacterium]
MEILAIIPARGGSKGIPNKNIKDLAGHPLIYYSIKAGQESKYVTRTVLSTEDENVKKIAVEKCNCEVIDRPKELAQDETKTIPVLIQVCDVLKQKEGYEPDVVVLLQPTTPTRNSKQLDEAFELFFNNDCDSVFAAQNIGTTHSKWRQNPHTKEFECLFDYRHRPRRQDTDLHYPMFQETGSIYIIKTDVMREVYDFIGKNPLIYETRAIDIDTPEDFEKIAEIMKENET